MVKVSVYSIRKRTREDLGKEMEVAHAVVRWREQNMHGRIFVPGIEEKKRRWQFSSRMSPLQREAYSGRPRGR